MQKNYACIETKTDCCVKSKHFNFKMDTLWQHENRFLNNYHIFNGQPTLSCILMLSLFFNRQKWHTSCDFNPFFLPSFSDRFFFIVFGLRNFPIVCLPLLFDVCFKEASKLLLFFYFSLFPILKHHTILACFFESLNELSTYSAGGIFLRWVAEKPVHTVMLMNANQSSTITLRCYNRPLWRVLKVCK